MTSSPATPARDDVPATSPGPGPAPASRAGWGPVPPSAPTRPATPGQEPAVAGTASRGDSQVLIRLLVTLVVLVGLSLVTGVVTLNPVKLLLGRLGPQDTTLLVESRIPRTAAAALAGAAMATAGALMQLLVRNRFVAPSTTGTVQFATAGILAATVLAPSASMTAKMGAGAASAAVGSALFLWLLRRLPVHRPNDVLVPLVGIMLAGVVEAATTFVAWRLDLMQTLGAWTSGDLSGKVAGRYELLWGVGVMTLVAWFAADRFTVAGLGRDRAVGLGLAYDRTMALGMVIVSLTSAVTVVVVGSLPFLGLVVPNMVSLVAGDSLRRSLPWMAVGGAVMVLVCDVLGRLVNHPYEISVGLVMGVVGSLLFLIMLLRSTR